MEGNDLALQFLADLYRRTDIPDERAFQQALQAFADELIPWINPGDLPTIPREICFLFERMEVTEEDITSVTLTPEGVALFRAWLRRRGLDPLRGTS
jgi:hypothetical protein